MSDIISDHQRFTALEGERRMLDAQSLRGGGVWLALSELGGGVTFELTADQAHQLAQWLVAARKGRPMSDAAMIAARLTEHDDDLAALTARLERVEALLGPWLADQAAALDPRNHPQGPQDAPTAPRRAGDAPKATHDPDDQTLRKDNPR